MRRAVIAAAICALAAAPPAVAFQPAQPTLPAVAAVQPSAALRLRGDQMVELFNGKRTLADYFVAGIAVERFNANLAAVRADFGAALRISGLNAITPNSAVVIVDFEKGQRLMRLRVTDEPPHLVNDFGSAG